ncbi:phosphoribosylglycinamide formyltransferase [Marinicella rhabdoformis]|uniref:phosphoribosylglycinamide formyltransferase n=1 Tax=Marinicella rhabdoformis TaxID=2580566 RepID=UPI0012AED76A|nr:phosphoribosylglycinamide formyltransferase [Marinicella rhabdoformis]
MKVVVFISGRGSNLAALLNAQQSGGFEVVHVISNKASAYGLEIAQENGVNNSHIVWTDKQQGEQYAIEVLNQVKPDLIVLAGFMKVLSAQFVAQFENKIINIHPSLLPLYPGLNTHQRAIDDGQTIHGASVHLVDDQLDHGLVLSQCHVEITQQDTADSLAVKLITKEHRLLTETVALIAANKLTWIDSLALNGEPLASALVIE